MNVVVAVNPIDWTDTYNTIERVFENVDPTNKKHSRRIGKIVLAYTRLGHVVTVRKGDA